MRVSVGVGALLGETVYSRTGVGKEQGPKARKCSENSENTVKGHRGQPERVPTGYLKQSNSKNKDLTGYN